jgi:pimeloyl-ACP methyl ester carboxylesterase
VQRHPATVSDLVDAAERYLDERGLERPHLAGHSLGGQMAIELARRGRAATVCALAPGGLFPVGDLGADLRTHSQETAKERGDYSPHASRCPAYFEVGDMASARLAQRRRRLSRGPTNRDAGP